MLRSVESYVSWRSMMRKSRYMLIGTGAFGFFVRRSVLLHPGAPVRWPARLSVSLKGGLVTRSRVAFTGRGGHAGDRDAGGRVANVESSVPAFFS